MAAAPGWSWKKTAAFVIIAIILGIFLIVIMGNDLLSPLLGRYEKDIVIQAKYTVPPQEGRGHERYVIFDTGNVSYMISDAGYPENMHVYDSFREGFRYGILTDGSTVFSVTKRTEEVVFDQKSIRYQDGRWVHNETEIEKLLRSGEIKDPGSVEWTVRGVWTSIRYDTSPELWKKIRVYTPAKPWQYEVPEVPYRCLVGTKKVYSWRPESYQYVYDIENLDEYNRYYTGR